MEAWRRGGASRRYHSSDAEEFGLPELAHSVERFARDGNLGRGIVNLSVLWGGGRLSVLWGGGRRFSQR